MYTDNGLEENKHIGVWGHRHLRYIKQHKKNPYFELYVSGRLNGYFAQIEAQTEDMFLRLVKELSEQERVTEALKAENQFLWVQRSNCIHTRAIEIVNHELIYT